MGCGNPHGCPHTQIGDQQPFVLLYDAIRYGPHKKSYVEQKDIAVAICSEECSEALKQGLARDSKGNDAINIRVMTVTDWLLLQDTNKPADPHS